MRRKLRLKTLLLSIVVMIGWLAPVSIAWVLSYALTDHRPYWPTLAVALILGIPMLLVSRLVRAPALWLLSGVMFGATIFAPWIPLDESHSFFIHAGYVRPGMTVEEVRQIMRGFSEDETIPAPHPFNKSLNYEWDRDGPSSMDLLSVDFVDGRVSEIFVGTE